MGFQAQVNPQQAPGVEGAFCSENPIASVVASQGALVAGVSGLTVGHFAWQLSGAANNSTLLGVKPDGFVPNTQQALITVFLGDASLVIPAGYQCTLIERGDLFARSAYGDAAIGQKVFANLYTGAVLAAAAGSTPTDQIGTSGTVTASFATNVMTVTVTGIFLSKGMKVSGVAGIPPGSFIEAQLTGTTGSTGTYSLSTYPGTISSSAAVVITSPGGVGGAVLASVSFASAATVATINTITSGTVVAGQLVTGTGIAPGTVIASLGTSTGGAGTINLSLPTLSIQTAVPGALSGFVETDWFVNSNGNSGDLIKIGVRS